MSGGLNYDDLARVLNLPIEEIWDKVPMPSSQQAIQHRRRKKKELGLDVTEEEQAIKAIRIEHAIEKMKTEIANEPPLTTEQIHKLAGLAREVFGV